MDHPVDLHVLTLPGRDAWREALLASLEGQPCQVRLFPGQPRATGQARAEAFRVGAAPWVGHADDDDLVEPGAVQALLDALSAHPEAVGAYTDEILIAEDGRILAPGLSTGRAWSARGHLGNVRLVHHLWIGRRELVERYLPDVADMPTAMGWALTALMIQHGPWIHVPINGYRWRQHPGGSHHRGSAREIERMRAVIEGRLACADFCP